MKKKEVVEYTPVEIISNLDANFAFASKPFAKYCNESNPLWDRCIEIVNNVELMNKIIFCNDYLLIPPAQTTAAVLKDTKLSDYDKKFIGAFWGYVFSMFGYDESKKVTSNKTNIKTALCYLSNESAVIIIPNKENEVKAEIKIKKKTKDKKLNEVID